VSVGVSEEGREGKEGCGGVESGLGLDGVFACQYCLDLLGRCSSSVLNYIS
jgi:hypothetical protein